MLKEETKLTKEDLDNLISEFKKCGYLLNRDVMNERNLKLTEGWLTHINEYRESVPDKPDIAEILLARQDNVFKHLDNDDKFKYLEDDISGEPFSNLYVQRLYISLFVLLFPLYHYYPLPSKFANLIDAQQTYNLAKRLISEIPLAEYPGYIFDADVARYQAMIEAWEIVTKQVS